jgi:hypothetical protein
LDWTPVDPNGGRRRCTLTSFSAGMRSVSGMRDANSSGASDQSQTDAPDRLSLSGLMEPSGQGATHSVSKVIRLDNCPGLATPGRRQLPIGEVELIQPIESGTG